MFAKVCHAVQAAHAVGVIHQDLKPSNILVTQDNSVKLLDFGLAKASQECAHNAYGYMSFFYAAPEHLEQATLQTDIYSLGVILAELILGRPPFTLVEGSACRHAEEDATRALSIFREWMPPGHHMIAVSQVHLADSLSCQSRIPEATSLLRQALASYRASGDHAGATTFALSVFGAHDQRQGRYRGAIHQYSESLHAYQQLYHTPNANWCRPLLGIARAELSLGRPDLSARFATQASGLQAYGLEPGNPCLRQAELLLAYSKGPRPLLGANSPR
jgi:serine/threonine protein kinase